MSTDPALVWTPEIVDLLERHYQEGLSSSESARLLGFTRNKVLGKRVRMGLMRSRQTAPPLRPVVAEPTAPRLVPRDNPLPRAPKVKPGPFVEIAPDPAHMAGGKPISCLGERQCRWPLQATREEADAFTLFCAAPTRGDRRYCDEHHRRAYPSPSLPPLADALARGQMSEAA